MREGGTDEAKGHKRLAHWAAVTAVLTGGKSLGLRRAVGLLVGFGGNCFS